MMNVITNAIKFIWKNKIKLLVAGTAIGGGYYLNKKEDSSGSTEQQPQMPTLPFENAQLPITFTHGNRAIACAFKNSGEQQIQVKIEEKTEKGATLKVNQWNNMPGNASFEILTSTNPNPYSKQSALVHANEPDAESIAQFNKLQTRRELVYKKLNAIPEAVRKGEITREQAKERLDGMKDEYETVREELQKIAPKIERKFLVMSTYSRSFQVLETHSQIEISGEQETRVSCFHL